jgi:hypothetical protein
MFGIEKMTKLHSRIYHLGSPLLEVKKTPPRVNLSPPRPVFIEELRRGEPSA